jgi:DNA-binding CsgD family transcriptional regulator
MTGSPERGVADLLELGRLTQRIPFDNPADFPWRRYTVEGLALLGRNDEAVALAREELEIARRWGAAPTVAACLRALGNALGGEEGEALLRGAVEVAAESPARIQHARALVDLGAALRRGNKRAEARAAQEMTNKEIAQALFVTVKTVEVHLSSVHRKLAIGSRRQLAAALDAGG